MLINSIIFICFESCYKLYYSCDKNQYIFYDLTQIFDAAQYSSQLQDINPIVSYNCAIDWKQKDKRNRQFVDAARIFSCARSSNSKCPRDQ